MVPRDPGIVALAMNRTPIAFVLGLLAVVWLTGCETQPTMIIRSVGGVDGPTDYKVENPPELAGLIKVLRAVARNREGERVAQFDLQSLTTKPLHLEYQIRWRDRFGSELVSLWEWRNITIEPGRTVRLEDEVLDSEWVHYTVEMRLRK